MENINSEITELLALTAYYAGKADQVQGPGGNTSVKTQDGKMFIKASGFMFDEMSHTSGYSCVSFPAIRDYFNSVKIVNKVAEETNANTIVTENILKKSDGQLFPKPSMETGFHSVLDKYVIHTHSVYTNLLNCCKDSAELFQRLRNKLSFSIASIPFVSPGLGLSYLVANEIKRASQNGESVPAAFLLQNHGVIVHDNNSQRAVLMQTEIDKALVSIFELKNNYPSTRLVFNNGVYLSESLFLHDVLEKYAINDPAFFQNVLFPDQAVFFTGNISFNSTDTKKITYNKEAGFSYHAKEREARAIHETMTAYLFIYDRIVSSGRAPAFVRGEEVDYINGMDMEKYRKSLM